MSSFTDARDSSFSRLIPHLVALNWKHVFPNFSILFEKSRVGHNPLFPYWIKVLLCRVCNVSNYSGDPRYSMFNLSLKEGWQNNKHFCQSLAGSGKFTKNCYYVTLIKFKVKVIQIGILIAFSRFWGKSWWNFHNRESSHPLLIDVSSKNVKKIHYNFLQATFLPTLSSPN